MGSKKYKARTLNMSSSAYSTEEEYAQVLYNPKIRHFINRGVMEGIKHANDNNRKFASILEIDGFSRVLRIAKADWKPVLENLLPLYASVEAYEICSEIRDLIKEIKE